jgi:tetratricopeptide (TPR) repeat protein
MAYYNRALARAQTQDIEGAILDNTKAIELDPSYADAYFNRGSAYWKNKDYANTIADLEKAAALDPSFKAQVAPVIEQARQFMAEDAAAATAAETAQAAS